MNSRQKTVQTYAETIKHRPINNRESLETVSPL